ncbi:MAG: hypothetical protein ACRCTD_09110 [Beijerinckiaceae bacterium]
MFQSLINRVRQPIDDAIASMVGKILIALPLLFALIFLISALNNYLHTLLGPVGANLAMAGAFFALAVMAAIVVALQRSARRAKSPAAVASDSTAGVLSAVDQAAAKATGTIDGVVSAFAGSVALRPQDRDLAVAVLKTAVPLLLPKVLKLSLRNLPVIGLAGAAYYLVSRHGGAAARARTGPDEAAKQ